MSKVSLVKYLTSFYCTFNIIKDYFPGNAASSSGATLPSEQRARDGREPTSSTELPRQEYKVMPAGRLVSRLRYEQSSRLLAPPQKKKKHQKCFCSTWFSFVQGIYALYKNKPCLHIYSPRKRKRYRAASLGPALLCQ